MTCVSEGAVDVYVEPFVPKRRLVVVGTTPIAEALTRTALSLSYDVVRVVQADERRDLEQGAASAGVALMGLDTIDEVLSTGASDTAVVVASQGHYDEQALEAALKSRVEYVGLVASRKRGATILGLLERQGVPGVDSVRNPAGIDLGARTPSEVALSILAEIVQRRPIQAVSKAMAPIPHPMTEGADASSAPFTPAAERTALDPVCGMSVTIATAKHTAEVEGTAYYFCCPSCRARFVHEPARYLTARP
jgi:xanthine dehydrogenase accessory factor